MVEKINLWSFEEYEKFFTEEEEDIIKTCVFTSLLFENWPFKHKKNRHWTKIIRKIMKRIDNIYEEHFENGFQHKVFTSDNKVILSVLFGMIQRIYGFVEEPPVVKLQDRILKFAICFDPDVIFMTYNTVFIIGEPISISRTLPVHLEIFYKLAGFDISFNDSFPHIKDKIYKPVPFLVIEDSPIDAFWDSSAEYKFSDTYVTVLKNMLEKNEQFNSIIKQNIIMVLFSTLNSNEYYHRLSMSYDILDLEKDRDFIKKLNVENLLEESRRSFIVDLKEAGIFDIFNDLYSEAYQLSIEYNKREKINYETGLSKHLSYVRNLDLELKWSFERYLIFCAGYDLNIVHLIFILELGESNGIFYNTLENALRNPEYEKLNVFTLFESLLRLENQTVLNWDIILGYVSKYFEGKNDDILQCFLKDLLISTKENDDCFSALLKGNCVEKFCEYLENKDINEKNDIFIILIDILFHLYKKQNTKLEPFEESRFSRVCLHLIGLKDESVSIRCFNILSYFINADPLSIETLGKLGISNVLDNVKDSTCSEQLGICLINFIDALSLNIQYAQKLRGESVFSSILSSLNIYDINMPLLPDGSLIDIISVFLRHHPEYNGEYTLFCLNRFEQMVETYKSRTPTENEMKAVENFLESFSHLKSNTVLDKDNYKEKMVKLLVELYSHVSVYDNQPVSSIFTVYQMFVSILGFLNNGRSAVQFVVPKLEKVVNEIKEVLKARGDDKKIIIEEEYKILMLKGEKLVSLISGIINNFVSGKSMNRTLLENIMKYSLDLFLLTIDHIDGMYDHDVMGGSFISSYLDLGSKFNKGQNDSKDNYKLSSLLICLNNVFLLKYAIEEYDTGNSATSETFVSKYLDLISECLLKDAIASKGERKRVKSDSSKHQVDKIIVLCKVLQHLSEYFDRGMLQMFCLWMKKHDLFRDNDVKIKEIVLQILSNSVSIHIENEYKKMIIEFLQTFTTRSGEVSGMILTTITNFYGYEKKLDVDSEPLLASLVSKHYWSGCTYRCKFLMNSLDFIIRNIKEENYNIFVDSITEDTLCYFVLLVNFHYDDMMFNLLKCMLETLTFVKKKLDKEKLNAFIQKLRENHLFDVKYCLDDDDIMNKMVDKEGFLQLNLDFVLNQLNNEITKSYTEVTPMNWGFFLACEKYCEVRAGKFGVLSDTNLLDCCLFANCYEICLFPMLITHSIFSNLNDLYELKNKILDKKDVLTFYGLENDSYDYFPLAWRNPDIIFMKEAPKVNYNVITNMPDNISNDRPNMSACYSILMEFAFKHPNFLFVLSEIVYNYPRYISVLDLDYIKKIGATYLGDDLGYAKDTNKQIGAKRALEFFSICVHSHDPEFMKSFIIYIKSLLNGTVNEICNAIIILCNISNPLNTLTSGLEHGVKDKSIFVSFSELLKNDILDNFISVISKTDEKELPNLKELSDNSETLISNLGMKNPNFFLIQNHLVSINSYDISDFNSNPMNNSHDDLLNVGLNFIYNFLYTIYQKEIEDSGICDIEISEDDIEDDFDSTETFYNENATDNESSSTIYNETEDEEVFEDIEDVVIDEESKTSEESNVDAIPMIRSTYLRLETAYKTLDEENMRLIFENISNLVSKVENDPESESGQVSTANIEDVVNENSESIIEDDQVDDNDNEDSDESSIGVYDGFIPSKSPAELNEMTENEFNDYVSSLMDERKSTSLDYKPIDKNYLNELIKPYRYAFERYEAHLKDFYYPEFDMSFEKEEEHEKHQIILPLSENTVIELVKAFYNGKFTGKPQIYNIFKIMSLCAGTRDILLTESTAKLVKEVKDLRVDSHDFDNIRKSMEIIRIMTLKFEIGNKNEKVDVVRSLFKLLRHKSVAIKALHLLNKIDFGNEIFGLTEEYHDLDNFYIGRKKLIVSDVLKLSEAWISKKTTTYLKNVIKKICADTADILATSIIRNITNEFLHILSCNESMMLQKYIEGQSKILNLILIFDICFSSFFESFRNDHKDVIESFFVNIGMEYKNIENVDFKYLYNYYKHSQGLMSELKFYRCSVIGRTLSRNILDSLYYLIKDGIERVIGKLSKEKSSVIDHYYMSGLYNVYILIFSVYEGLINHFRIFGTEKKDIILKQFDDLRNDLSLFLDSNMNEINTIFSVEQDVFTQNIRFLSRFNVINFVNKHNYFRGKIQDFNLYKEGTYTINVRRKEVLSDSLFQIMNKTSKEFKAKRLQVKFSGEEGLDFGGITREWVDLLVKDLTMPDKGLFVYTSEKKTTFLPYRNSKVNPDHLLYFRFVGRILAKSILDRITLDLHIDKSVYKYFLGKKCELSDLEPIDPQFHNSLIWMRDNTIQDVIVMTFSFEYLEFGEMRIVDLKPDGRNIPVTDENKQEYIDLIVDYKLFKGIEMQLNSIKAGLFEIIDRDMLSIFNENEFELLINGIPDINVDDWMNNTEYHGYKNNSTNIIWFWKAVRSFSPEERAKLLQFSTGSSRVPFEGFSHLQGNNGPQKFSIHKSSSDNVRLPSAHTCFNQLDLPEYPSFSDLRKSLIYAINECSEGFGLI